MDTEKDPREVELSEIQSRLTTVFNLIGNNITVDKLDAEIASAENMLGDQNYTFIFHGSSAFTGTRHLKGLLQMEKALDTKVLFQGKKDLHKECVRLLERKLALVRELNAGLV